jgi:hypothetical protein
MRHSDSANVMGAMKHVGSRHCRAQDIFALKDNGTILPKTASKSFGFVIGRLATEIALGHMPISLLTDRRRTIPMGQVERLANLLLLMHAARRHANQSHERSPNTKAAQGQEISSTSRGRQHVKCTDVHSRLQLIKRIVPLVHLVNA